MSPGKTLHRLVLGAMVLGLLLGLAPASDPPLALLMRRMMAHAENTKLKVEAGKPLGKLPKDFHTLAALESSQEHAKGPAFEALAASYLAQAQRLHTRSDTTDARRRWNLVVAQCLACHQAYCPGPIRRIERLRVAETGAGR